MASDPVQPRLHILGCGRTARTLARVWHAHGLIEIGQVVNRGLASAQDAVAFIGAGQAVDSFAESLADGWLMIGLPDGDIEATAIKLASVLTAGPQLVFHLSGAIASEVLEPLGPRCAAIHPLKAFADPQAASERFAGTWCVAEGEDQALAQLQHLFTAAGARWLQFRPDDKTAWHAATVAASNFLVTIHALGRELALAAGISDGDAAHLLADLQRGGLDNLEQGPASASLTGPIERGDVDVCRRLREAAHRALGPTQAGLFDALALATVDLAVVKRGVADSDEALYRLFSSRPSG